MPDPTPSSDDIDPELLRRAQTGDEAAFGAVMRTHYERIFRLVYSMVRNEHDTRDVCQEIWLTVWRQLPGFRGEAKFTTWLHPIAVRRAIDHLRKNRRWYDRFLPFATGDATVESVPEPVAADDTRQDTEQAERRAQLHGAIAALPPKQRAVLALREIQGLSYEEIARATGIPTGTVMSRLYHARRLLAQKLGAKP
ncbi:MAG TPA: sigma-70 family RNA polymerase sigma factor [Lacunisphaera sp.]|nr:sigma-70 family RNA polymerase sigma factor [Lacunisphaera sp.]